MRQILFVLLATVLLGLQPSDLRAKKNEPKKGNTIENLLRPPRVYNMTMSPDGKYAASVAPIGDDGDRGIAIFDLETMAIHRSFKWAAKDIDSVTWTTNEDVAFKLSKWGAYVEGVFSVNVNRKSIYQLIANDAVVRFVDPIREESRSWIWIRDGIRVKKGLVSINARGNGQQLVGGRMEIAPTRSNSLLSDRIPEPNGEIFGWRIDQDHEPRIVSRFYEDKLEYLHRYNRDENWEPLPLDPETWSIELFGAEKNTIYIAGYNGEDTKGLYLYLSLIHI